ncbi:MAG: molybdopterin-synthase adenylyltransferase MoeB [bacterium]
MDFSGQDVKMQGFSREEVIRYSRHFAVPEIGAEGQKKLRASRVLVVGAGGLGSPALLYLAGAGVGTIGIADPDSVAVSNLHRQVLYSSMMEGRNKAECAAQRISGLNPCVRTAVHGRLGEGNVLEVLKDYDMVLDCSDNFTCRYLINDACVLTGKPDISGSIYRFEGQVSVFDAGKGACYRCLYPEPPSLERPDSCEDNGVAGPLPGIVGSIQALEAMKLILEKGTVLTGKLLIIDGLEMDFKKLDVARRPECPVCGNNPSISEPREMKAAFLGFCSTVNISPEELKAAIETGAKLQILDLRHDWEHDLCHIPGDFSLPFENMEKGLERTGLDPALPVVVYCKDAGRSAKAGELLARKGFGDVKILEGGIDAWAAKIEPGMMRY